MTTTLQYVRKKEFSRAATRRSPKSYSTSASQNFTAIFAITQDLREVWSFHLLLVDTSVFRYWPSKPLETNVHSSFCMLLVNKIPDVFWPTIHEKSNAQNLNRRRKHEPVLIKTTEKISEFEKSFTKTAMVANILRQSYQVWSLLIDDTGPFLEFHKKTYKSHFIPEGAFQTISTVKTNSFCTFIHMKNG